MVDPVDDGQVHALGRGRNQHALRASRKMLGGAFAIGEKAGAFQRDVDAVRGMRQLCRVSLRRHLDALAVDDERSEEHTSELQSLMRISYAVFCLKKKNNTTITLTLHHSYTDHSYINSTTT